MKKNASRLVNMIYRAEDVAEAFKFFACNEWNFDTRKVDMLMS